MKQRECEGDKQNKKELIAGSVDAAREETARASEQGAPWEPWFQSSCSVQLEQPQGRRLSKRVEVEWGRGELSPGAQGIRCDDPIPEKPTKSQQ